MITCSIDYYKILIAFVTGNANKLKEVKAILSQGGNPVEIDSQSLDSE
jgi:inosine triphosphate pyrophosphatase